MSVQTTSKARLRTRTGCSTCRSRKKKCDEVKPTCGRCSAASLPCTWQELAPDGRHKHFATFSGNTSMSPETSRSNLSEFSPHAADSWFIPDEMDPGIDNFELQSFMDLMIDWAPEMTVADRQIGEDSWLFEYWHETWLPSLLHKHSHPRFWDFSYMRFMAEAHCPLMETALACAAMSQFYKESEDPDWMAKMRDKALTHHTNGVAALRDEMSTGKLDGTEDWVLATITGLALFDNRDPKATPTKSQTHVTAIFQLFKVRQASKNELPVVQLDEKKLNFERIHYEYLLYHSTIFMVYDPTFDALVGNSVWAMIESYFINSTLSVDNQPENWPILGIPYKLFRLIIVVSRLGRRCPLRPEDLDIASAVWKELFLWSGHVDIISDVSIGTLYIMGAKILLQEILIHQSNNPSLVVANQVDAQNCMQLVDRMEIGTHFSRSLVWPLAILHGAMTSSDDKLIIKEKMRTVLEMADGGGPVSVTQKRVDSYLVVPGIPAVRWN